MKNESESTKIDLDCVLHHVKPSYGVFLILFSCMRCKVVEETLASGEQTPTKGTESVVEDIIANEFSTPIGIR